MTRRRFASDEVVQREIQRAIDVFGSVKSWELTPDGGVKVLPGDGARMEVGHVPGTSAAADGVDELAAARAKRDARRDNRPR
jgi:hypothetical protein